MIDVIAMLSKTEIDVDYICFGPFNVIYKTLLMLHIIWLLASEKKNV